MKCSKSALVRFADVVCLTLVFLFQNVMLNYIIILHHSSTFVSFLWFLGDFFCLVLFSFTVFLAHTYHHKLKKREKRTASRASFASGARSCTPPGSASSSDESYMHVNNLFGNSKLPITYMSWLYYSLLLILKITVLFKSDIPQRLSKDDTLGPQMLKFCIGLSTIVFSLLIESHHNAVGEPLRNAYLNSVAYGVALEILDSTSFLSMLIPSETHLSYTYSLENYIIALASVNIMLPAVTIYKLSASNFGRAYNVPLEALYKFLHLIFVNIPFLCLRIYLWSMFSTDSAIFMIKNIYGIIGFIRGAYPDIVLLKQVLRQRQQLQQAIRNPENPGPNSRLSTIPNGGSNRNVQVIYRNENITPIHKQGGVNGATSPTVSIEDRR